jgi:hypothetical protein
MSYQEPNYLTPYTLKQIRQEVKVNTEELKEKHQEMRTMIYSCRAKKLRMLMYRYSLPLSINRSLKHHLGRCDHCHQNNCPIFYNIDQGFQIELGKYSNLVDFKKIVKREKLELSQQQENEFKRLEKELAQRTTRKLKVQLQRLRRRMNQSHPFRNCPALEGCPLEHSRTHRKWYHHPLYSQGELILKRALVEAQLKMRDEANKFARMKRRGQNPKWVFARPLSREAKRTKVRIHKMCLRLGVKRFTAQPQWALALSTCPLLTIYLWGTFPSEITKLAERNFRVEQTNFSNSWSERPFLYDLATSSHSQAWYQTNTSLKSSKKLSNTKLREACKNPPSLT